MLKNIYLILFIAATLACKADIRVSAKVGTTDLKPDQKQSLVAKEIVTMIETHHFKKVLINDSLSSVIFDKYLESLDGGHNYLLKSDIKDFEKYRKTLDDDLREGDLSAPFYMYNVFQKRYDERIKYSLNALNSPFNFAQNETYIYNRAKLPWLASSSEADELWRKRIKYELVNLKIAGTDPVKNIQTLKQRYENLLSQSGKVNNQDVFQRIMNSFTEAIDPHTNYFNPTNAQSFNEQMSKNFEGIGAGLVPENEIVKVSAIITGGPAFRAKTLKVDDRIIGVAQGKNGEFEDIIGWRIDAAVAKIKGPKGTVVRLKIIPAGQELSSQPKIVELVRDKVVLQDQLAKRTIKTVTSGDRTYKIGVIEIPDFYLDFKAYQANDPNYQSTTRDVRRLLDTLKQEKVDGVVIDLRQNGGGSLIEAIELTGLFIKNGPVVQVKDTRGRIEINSDDNPAIAWDGPFGVIIDRFSASASEIFAGAIQDYGRGIIMGTQTYGKGTVQSAISLDRVIKPLQNMIDKITNKEGEVTSAAKGYGQINLTIGKFYRVNGSSTQHKGVMPDIEFPMVFPADKYGESSEPAALPWDIIKASSFKSVADLSSIKQQLIPLHTKRMMASPEYKYLLEDIEQYKKRENETSVPLNEVQLKNERAEQETKTLARENQRRTLAGLAALKKGEAKPKSDVDFIQDESLQVMADFIKLGKSSQLTFKF
ncbi:MAG TPA: carboxy terminal-processing peptidase [Sphingobacteriaceae bacterium]|nr:carboxy terminal-processing peptidase [Sphingobacteriaceae bacterium]